MVEIQDEIQRLQALGLLSSLLADKATNSNIRWATDVYQDKGRKYQRDMEITVDLITGSNCSVIETRAQKAMEQQTERTRQRGEVFTPLWVCQKMNDFADEVWFGQREVFIKDGQPTDRVIFPKKRDWQEYVDDLRMELTCGEAPYLVSRYDVATGEKIPIVNRIGILDRKLRVVNENTADEIEWMNWAVRAFQATYGYEFQGDSLLIARVNLLMTFEEYLFSRWKREPSSKEYQAIVKIIVWNIWQMDGLTGAIPYHMAQDRQRSLFELMDSERYKEQKTLQAPCMIRNWREKRSLPYKKVNTEGKSMKFNFVIGNPPYQESIDTYNRSEPIYPYFYDETEKISDRVILISPARFLFNAGLTSKAWNLKMLADKHLKVVEYFPVASEVFPNTEIKGGVAIVYRDKNKNFGAIREFIPDETLRKIVSHFKKSMKDNLPSIMYGGRSDLKFNKLFIEEHPESIDARLAAIKKKHPNVTELAPNEEFELKSSTLDTLGFLFSDVEPNNKENFYKILGISSGKRIFKWIERRYMSPRYQYKNNIDSYKVLFPEANGNGILGEVMSKPVVLEPMESATPSFISMGKFTTKIEAMNACKYIKTKLVRTLLGVMKKTQHTAPSNWAYVPLQDFTPSSDIDWSKSISEIDRQLYAKYGLDEQEIEFIETHVKEML